MADDVTEKEVDKATKPKTADKPHHISLILSIGAIVISSLSWWESHQGRLINEEANRPVLSMVGVEPEFYILDRDRGTSEHITFKVRLKNTGKVTTLLTRLEVLASIQNSSKCEINNVNIVDDSTVWEGTALDIAPGEEESILRDTTVSDTCESANINFAIFVEYTNPNGRKFFQHYDVPINLPISELRQEYIKQHPSKVSPPTSAKHSPTP